MHNKLNSHCNQAIFVAVIKSYLRHKVLKQNVFNLKFTSFVYKLIVCNMSQLNCKNIINIFFTHMNFILRIEALLVITAENHDTNIWDQTVFEMFFFLMIYFLFSQIQANSTTIPPTTHNKCAYLCHFSTQEVLSDYRNVWN